MTLEQEEREQQSAQELYDQLMQDTRPRGTSLAATTAISAVVRQSIHMAVRNADGSINEDNARKILDETRNALGRVRQRRRRS
jgi:hypothetical protein